VVTFREWKAADVEEIAALVVACDELTARWAPPGWELPPGHAEREIEAWHQELTNGDWRAEVAVDADDSIVGVVGTDADHVASLFVEPRLHGHGLGAALLTRAEAWIREAGHDRATLNVLDGSPAVRFYERNGWTPSGDRGHFDRFDMDTIGYEKRL
jgi:GNAT superfamily N-acetyltransferase